MPTYTPIIKYLLLWQLALPILIVQAGLGWLWATVTMVLFIVLYRSKKWESNSYSRYGALAVVISSALFVFVTQVNGSDAIPNPLELLIPNNGRTAITTPWTEYLSMIVWLFSMIAFTATSPYPLGIRMPLVVYTVFYLLVGKSVEAIQPIWLLIAAVVFSALMLMNLYIWKDQTHGVTAYTSNASNSSSNSLSGPAEPPFSFSLATAIVLILVLALSSGIGSLFWRSSLLDIIPLVLVSFIVLWLLCAKDWKKNILAISALLLILASNITSIAAIYIHNQTLRTIAFLLTVAPVVFHTTAPVFRGMRITITLYATYNAFCKAVFGHYLLKLFPDILQLPAYGFIAFDALVLVALILMALHWKRSEDQK